MGEDKIVRVVGLSSAVLFNKDDPLSPVNRRISLIVMNKKAEEAARHDGGKVGVEAEANDENLGDTIKQGVGVLPPAPMPPAKAN
jgi:chemotaxis protein MotB